MTMTTISHPAIPLRVLVVEDDENDALLLVDALQTGGYTVEWQRIDSEDAMTRALGRQWDIILSDYSMPGFSGTRALNMLRARESDTPFIFCLWNHRRRCGSRGHESGRSGLCHERQYQAPTADYRKRIA